MSSIHFPITGDNSNFMAALHQVTQGVRDASSQIQAEGGAIEAVFSKIKQGLTILGIGTGLKELVSQTASTRSEFQKLEIAFKTFLGSEQEANKLMNQLVDTAAKTPFDLKGVAESAKGLLAFGIQADEVNKIVVSLGDVAAGLSQPLSEIVYLYGTTVTKPKMDTMDLKQHLGRGIPIARELAKELGVVESEVAGLVSAGKVTGEIYKKAFDNLTGEGSMFGGLMEAQSKSIQGQIDNIADSVDMMFNEIGKTTQPIFNSLLSTTSDIVDHWREVLLIVGDIAVAYGSQKAWLALDAGFTKAATKYGYEAEAAQLRALLPVKEEEKQSSLQQAVAAGTLTKAKADEIETLREEAQAQLDALIKKEQLAKAEEANALAKSKAADKEVEAIEKEIESTWDRITAGMESLTAEEAETAVTELDTLETMRNEAANIAQAASEDLRAASTTAATVAEERETLATGINTAQNAGNTASVGILTIAKEKLIAAMQKLNTVMAANKFAIVTGLVIALGYAVYKAATYESELTQSLKSADQACNDQEASLQKELSSLNSLKKNLENAKKGTDNWKSAKDSIVSQFGQYLNNLDSEISKVGNLSTTYNQLTKAVRLSAAARALDAYRQDNNLDEDINRTQEIIRESLTDRKLIKVDNNGNIIRSGEHQAFIHTYIGGRLLKNIMSKVYEYQQTGDISIFNPKELGYLNQTGQLTKLEGFSTLLQSTRKKIDAKKEGEKLIAERYGTTVEEIEGRTTNIVTPEHNLQESYAQSSMRYNKAKSEVDKIKQNRSAYTDKQWESAIEELKVAKDEFEKLGGETKQHKKKSSGSTPEQIGAKQKEAHQKILDLMKKQAEEKIKLEIEYEFEREQNRIDLMQEGENKVLAQMALDQKKELSALEDRKQAAIQAEIERQKSLFDAQEDEKAAGNKKYAKKVFDPTSIYDPENNIINENIQAIISKYDNLNADLLDKQKKAKDDRLKAEQESFNNFYKEFGDYYQKRLAIQNEYQKKLSEAQNEGDRMMITAQMQKDLSDLDFTQWIDNGDLNMAFGNIENLSQETIDQLIKDMERYRSKIVATFDPDKIQKYNEALKNLRSAKINTGFFDEDIDASGFADKIRERILLEKELQAETNNMNTLIAERNSLEQNLQWEEQKLEWKNNNGIADPEAEQNVRKMRVQLTSVNKSIQTSANNSKRLQSNLNAISKVKYSAIKTLGKQVLNVGKNAAEFAKIWGDDVADGINSGIEALETAIDVTDSLASSIDVLIKNSGKSVEEAAEAGKQAVDAAGQGMQTTTQVTSSSMKAMESASAILAIIAAAIQLATMIASLVDPDKKHEKNIEKLQDQIDSLQESYDDLGDAIEKAYSSDSADLIDQQNELLRQQMGLVRQQKEEEKAKKDSDKDKVKDYDKTLREQQKQLEENRQKAKEAIIGEDIKSAISNFAEAYAGAWEDGTKAASASMKAVKSLVTSALTELLKKNLKPATEEFYNELARAMRDGILTNDELEALDKLKKELDDLALKDEATFKALQERYRTLEEIQEELTDIDFESVQDNFKSLLSDMESSSANFADSFSDMLRNALISGLMDAKYNKLLEEWYAEFAKAMEDGKLSDEEREKLRQDYNSIVEQGIKDRNEINDIVGGGAYSQDASSGGFESMSQDTAEELNGRFTALVEIQASSKSLQGQQYQIGIQTLNSLKEHYAGIQDVCAESNSTLTSMKDMLFLSTNYLEDIAKYTKRLNQLTDTVSEIKNIVNTI